MNDNLPLYNSRIIKIYIEFLRKTYPGLDIDTILSYAEINRYEIEDPAQWFSQRQTDRFYDILVEKTGNPNIARDAGNYTASSEGLGPAKQYTLGLLNPTSAYLLIGKVYPLFSRGATATAKKAGFNKIEIVSTPKLGVLEKPYQCENRIGMFESVSKLFTAQFATIEHPTCFHRGDDCCRYLISWEKTPFLKWKRFRNYSLIIGLICSVLSIFTFPLAVWLNITFLSALITLFFSGYSEFVEKTALANTLETQGNAAKDLIDEMNIRHNNALLVQEIGQATSTILDTNKLLDKVMTVMQNHLTFDRGLIMFANKEKNRLIFKAGFGYTSEQEELIRHTEFHLDNPESKGVFVLTYKLQKPFLVNDINNAGKSLSKRSLELAKKMGVHSLICVPIIYERESLGILAVDNIESKRPSTKSDINLLMGVASQTAVSIINARSFQKIQESEKKYRDLVENANSIIMRRDIYGHISFFNEFAQKFFGYTEKEILGKNISGTIMSDTKATARSLEKLVMSFKKDPEKQIIEENKNILRNKESVWIAWTYKPIFDHSQNLIEILCIGNDITELKNSEQEKRELETRLQRAQKMEAIGTLAGGVAHDLNNILSGLVSYPELILMDIPPDSPLRKPILTIQKSGEKAASIVQDLLTLARRGVSISSVVNLNDIIKDYLKSPEYEKLKLYNPNIQAVTQLDPNLLNILGSPVHLSKTVMNLAINAAEAMPDGGKIFFKTENRYIDKPLNGYDEVQEGNYITFTVADNGIGISSHDLERIFEPFYSKKVMGTSGTGLGLAVIWGTVKDHNGYIDVQSTEGKGTTFMLYFPVTRQELVQTNFPTAVDELMGNGESILIVDDVPEQRDIASQLLSKLGYSTWAVSNGEEAVEYLRNHSVDLLVLDMIMDPGMNGLETYKKIIEIHPGQKAIVVSGFSESFRVREVQRLGAGAYIKKPYLLEKIGIAVRDELGK